MQTNSIVIVGAGPVGITTACVLKATNPNLHITVLDKRADPKRKHGLSIDSGSIAKINSLLTASTNEQAANLHGILANWSGHFVRTNDIETTLAKLAKSMGVEVLRDATYELEKGNLKKALTAKEHTGLSQKIKNLQPILKAASVIIAADGAHSVLRDELSIGLTDEKTLKYMVELKYQTKGSARPQNPKEAMYQSSKTGHITFESVNRHTTTEDKPATYLVFVDKATYKSLRIKDDSQKLKGVYGNAWSLKELETLGKNNPLCQSVHNTMTRYLQSLPKQQGSYSEGAIATVKLKVYRNEKSAALYQGKPVVFVGDANSGLVLQRGFNKGLKEVALCVQAVSKFLTSPQSPQNSLPKEFLDYQQASLALFKDELSSIYFKDKAIDVAQSCATASSTVVQKIDRAANNILKEMFLFVLWSSKKMSQIFN